MKWINKFSEGSFGLFAGQSLNGLQPLDFYHFFPLWYDLWIERTAMVIKKLNLEDKKFEEVRDVLPSPSNMRAILIKIISTYQVYYRKNHNDCRIVTNFLARMLMECCPGDPFAKKSNPLHKKDELDVLIKNIIWEDVQVEKAKKIGQLNTAAGSLVHGLYNDIVTDFGWDVYGPYKIKKNGNDYTLLIRHFSNLRPKELWPAKYLPKEKEVFIYNMYQGVDWEIVAVGCHTISKRGNPVQGMKKCAIIADGQFLPINKADSLIKDFSKKAELIYRKIHEMNFEEIKKMAMLQECYQFKKMFDASGEDWKPTKEMIGCIKGKKMVKNFLPHGKIMTDFEEYKRLFGINKFAKEVLGEKKRN